MFKGIFKKKKKKADALKLAPNSECKTNTMSITNPLNPLNSLSPIYNPAIDDTNWNMIEDKDQDYSTPVQNSILDNSDIIEVVPTMDYSPPHSSIDNFSDSSSFDSSSSDSGGSMSDF